MAQRTIKFIIRTNKLPAEGSKSGTGSQDSRPLWLQVKWSRRSPEVFYCLHFPTGKLGFVMQLFAALSVSLTSSSYFLKDRFRVFLKWTWAVPWTNSSSYKDTRHSSPTLSLPLVTPWLSEERSVATRSQTLHSAAMIFYSQVPMIMIRTQGKSQRHFCPPLLLHTAIHEKTQWVLIELGEYADEKGLDFYSGLDETCIPWSHIQPLNAQIYALHVISYFKLFVLCFLSMWNCSWLKPHP